MKTTLLIVLLLTCSLFACSQHKQPAESKPEIANFSLSLRTYNHAGRMMDGTLIFQLNDTVLTISKRYMFSEIDTVLFSNVIEGDKIERIRNIKMDDLEDFYFNDHVMATSGQEYFISRTSDTITKEVYLHHYYHERIEKLINELNSLAPDEYQIPYLKSAESKL